MFQTLRRLTPSPLLNLYRKAKRRAERRRNEARSTEEIFSEIYAQNKWGGEEGDFYSGGGTGDEGIANAYVECLSRLGEELGFAKLRAVDLGCGDMRVGARISPLFASYLGVDIVEELIAGHRERLANERVDFACLNIIESDLPEGDVCLIRQVLQHLSNAQIAKILKKLGKYRYVLITEHLPTPNPKLRKNLDKPHGSDVRMYDNSGVYLTEPPFNLPESRVETVLEVEGHGYENYDEPWIRGNVQTVLYRPGNESD